MSQIADLAARVSALEDWKNDLQSKIEASEEAEKNYRKSRELQPFKNEGEDSGSGNEETGPIKEPAGNEPETQETPPSETAEGEGESKPPVE